MTLYGIKDTKAMAFNQPFLMVNDQVAIRSVKAVAADKQTELGKYPEDYELWSLGEYDDKTGIITSDIKHIVNIGDLVEVENEVNI